MTVDSVKFWTTDPESLALLGGFFWIHLITNNFDLHYEQGKDLYFVRRSTDVSLMQRQNGRNIRGGGKGLQIQTYRAQYDEYSSSLSIPRFQN